MVAVALVVVGGDKCGGEMGNVRRGAWKFRLIDFRMRKHTRR